MPDSRSHKARSFHVQRVAREAYALIWDTDDSTFGGYGANQGFLVLEESVLVFDTGLSLAQARALDGEISKVTEKKIRYIVNSHDHSDHVFGNSYFAGRYAKNGLDIISHVNCKRRLQAEGPARLKGYAKISGMQPFLKSIKITEPQMTYPDVGFELNLEGTELIFVHPPTGAHTLGDTLLCVPKRNLIFAGDVVWNFFLPNLEDANLEGWIDFLEDGIDTETYRICVPGHGAICGASEILFFKQYLKCVRERLTEVGGRLEPNHKKNVNRTELRTCFEIPGTEDWKLRFIIDHNVDKLFFGKRGFR